MEELKDFLKAVDDGKLKDYVNEVLLGTHVPQELADLVPIYRGHHVVMVTNRLVLLEAAKRFVRG